MVTEFGFVKSTKHVLNMTGNSSCDSVKWICNDNPLDMYIKDSSLSGRIMKEVEDTLSPDMVAINM